MRLSQSGRYAIRAAVAIAADKGPGLPDARRVAAAHGLPGFFASKLLRRLVTAGLLQSLRGANGGFRLARAAGHISLLEIVEAVDGPIRGQDPAAGSDQAGRLERRLQLVFDQAAQAVRRQWGAVTVSDLLATKGRG
jgi:Rrf2 family protein